jgi:hypothetical protein
MKTLKITILCGFMTMMGFSQTVLTVDNRDQSGGQFTSVQAAIDAASANDIIQILPSPTSYGNFTINKKLTLVGLGHNPVNVGGEVATMSLIRFINNSAGSELKGLVISNISIGTSTTSPNQSNISIRNCRISSISGSGSSTPNLSDGWILEGNYITSNIVPQMNSNNWQIRNNFIRGSIVNINNTCIITNNIFFTPSTSATFFSNAFGPLVNNNMFLATGNLTQIGISNSTITFVSNMTYSYFGSTIAPLAGSNNLDNTNPMFVSATLATIANFYGNNFDLAEGSPGINAGSDMTDIGLFGNGFAFDVNGRPELTPYPESITITNSVVAPGQTLNVNFIATQRQ